MPSKNCETEHRALYDRRWQKLHPGLSEFLSHHRRPRDERANHGPKCYDPEALDDHMIPYLIANVLGFFGSISGLTEIVYGNFGDLE